MWGPKGQQVMIPTPGQPTKHYGIGAVNYHTRETVVLFRPRKRRREIAELLRALLDKHQTETTYVAWDNAVKVPHEIEMPIVTPILAVGYSLETYLFLFFDCFKHKIILFEPQLICSD